MKRYEVLVNGMKTTLKLTDDDARRRGLLPVEEKAKTPDNKQAKPSANKSAAADKRAETASRSFGRKGDARA
ncbi:hypothetical protein [Mycolicibacterium elephantis]|uniref:hypothetical protein n=1 Tax=Mycolicibacterium elephantis TaxID=81858 RepID=UPI0007E9792D|nr:hypothetical protein [Mycolicibacterium elephantis]OBB20631.1 hypothetical protein A5762_15235 [Mycolicibacterium elephantis]